MAAAKFRLNRLIALVDYNHVQLDGRNDEVMPLGDLQAKWKAFGWNAIEIDGHDVTEIGRAIEIRDGVIQNRKILSPWSIRGTNRSWAIGTAGPPGSAAWAGERRSDRRSSPSAKSEP